MHSGRMCTARLLPISPSMHYSRGDCTWSGGYLVWGVYLVQEVPGPGVGGVPGLGDVPGPGMYLVWGCTWLGGVPGQGVPGARGVPGQGCTWSWGWGWCTCPGTPPVNRMTDRCKNITLPQTSFAAGKYKCLSCVKLWSFY